MLPAPPSWGWYQSQALTSHSSAPHQHSMLSLPVPSREVVLRTPDAAGMHTGRHLRGAGLLSDYSGVGLLLPRPVPITVGWNQAEMQRETSF